MTRNDIFDIIVAHSPSGIQWVNPYQNDIPLPKTNYVTLQVLNVKDVGNSQHRTVSREEEGVTVYDIEYAQERIYDIQIDGYGDSTIQDTVLSIKFMLKDYFTNNINTTINLKEMGDVENLTFLEKDKKYLERYSLRMSFFIIDNRTEANIDVLNKIVPICEHIASK